MTTGVVTGEVFSTINHPFYDGRTLLIIERTDDTGSRTGDYLVAVDRVGAGPGQPVLVLDEGTGARQICGSPQGPVRSIVVGILDDVVVSAG